MPFSVCQPPFGARELRRAVEETGFRVISAKERWRGKHAALGSEGMI